MKNRRYNAGYFLFLQTIVSFIFFGFTVSFVSAADENLMRVDSVTLSTSNLQSQPIITITGVNLPELRYMQGASSGAGSNYYNLLVSATQTSGSNSGTWGCSGCLWGFDQINLNEDHTVLTFRLRSASGTQWYNNLPTLDKVTIRLTDYNGNAGTNTGADRVSISFNKNSPEDFTTTYVPIRSEPEPEPDLTPPAVPTGLNGTATDTQISLTWMANDETDLAGYNIYRDGTKLNDILITDTAYVDENLSSGTSYSYEITAVDLEGNESGKSNNLEIETNAELDTDPPAAPAGFSLTNGSGFVLLYWIKNSETDMAGYNIYQDGIKIAELVNGTSYSVNDLDNNTTYDFYITAVDTSGNESLPSPILLGKPSIKTIPTVQMDYKISDLSLGISNMFAALWLIIAFIVGFGVALILAKRIKGIF